MRRKVFILALATLLVVGTISIAFSQGTGRRGRGFGRDLDRGKRIADKTQTELNLTKEQQKKLQSLRIDFAKETVKLRNDMQIKSLELRQLWLADELDEEAILAKAKEVSELRSQLNEKRILHRIAATKILTKEQRAKLSTGRLGRGDRPGRGLLESGNGGHWGMGRGRHWKQ